MTRLVSKLANNLKRKMDTGLVHSDPKQDEPVQFKDIKRLAKLRIRRLEHLQARIDSCVSNMTESCCGFDSRITGQWMEDVEFGVQVDYVGNSDTVEDNKGYVCQDFNCHLDWHVILPQLIDLRLREEILKYRNGDFY